MSRYRIDLNVVSGGGVESCCTFISGSVGIEGRTTTIDLSCKRTMHFVKIFHLSL